MFEFRVCGEAQWPGVAGAHVLDALRCTESDSSATNPTQSAAAAQRGITINNSWACDDWLLLSLSQPHNTSAEMLFAISVAGNTAPVGRASSDAEREAAKALIGMQPSGSQCGHPDILMALHGSKIVRAGMCKIQRVASDRETVTAIYTVSENSQFQMWLEAPAGVAVSRWLLVMDISIVDEMFSPEMLVSQRGEHIADALFCPQWGVLLFATSSLSGLQGNCYVVPFEAIAEYQVPAGAPLLALRVSCGTMVCTRRSCSLHPGQPVFHETARWVWITTAAGLGIWTPMTSPNFTEVNQGSHRTAFGHMVGATDETTVKDLCFQEWADFFPDPPVSLDAHDEGDLVCLTREGSLIALCPAIGQAKVAARPSEQLLSTSVSTLLHFMKVFAGMPVLQLLVFREHVVVLGSSPSRSVVCFFDALSGLLLQSCIIPQSRCVKLWKNRCATSLSLPCGVMVSNQLQIVCSPTRSAYAIRLVELFARCRFEEFRLDGHEGQMISTRAMGHAFASLVFSTFERDEGKLAYWPLRHALEYALQCFLSHGRILTLNGLHSKNQLSRAAIHATALWQLSLSQMPALELAMATLHKLQTAESMFHVISDAAELSETTTKLVSLLLQLGASQASINLACTPDAAASLTATCRQDDRTLIAVSSGHGQQSAQGGDSAMSTALTSFASVRIVPLLLNLVACFSSIPPGPAASQGIVIPHHEAIIPPNKADLFSLNNFICAQQAILEARAGSDLQTYQCVERRLLHNASSKFTGPFPSAGCEVATRTLQDCDAVQSADVRAAMCSARCTTVEASSYQPRHPYMAAASRLLAFTEAGRLLQAITEFSAKETSLLPPDALPSIKSHNRILAMLRAGTKDSGAQPLQMEVRAGFRASDHGGVTYSNIKEAISTVSLAQPRSPEGSLSVECGVKLLQSAKLHEASIRLLLAYGDWNGALSVLSSVETQDGFRHGISRHFLDGVQLTPHSDKINERRATISCSVGSLGDMALLGLLHVNTWLQQSPPQRFSDVACSADVPIANTASAHAVPGLVKLQPSTFSRMSCFGIVFTAALASSNLSVLIKLWSRLPEAFGLPAVLATVRQVLLVSKEAAMDLPAWAFMPALRVLNVRHKLQLEALSGYWRQGGRSDRGVVLREWGKK